LFPRAARRESTPWWRCAGNERANRPGTAGKVKSAVKTLRCNTVSGYYSPNDSMTRAAARLFPLGGLVLLTVWLWAADAPPLDRRLAQHRNLGKAFYENPTTQSEAVAEFKKALDLAPDSTQEELNYGLALLRAGTIAEAVERLKAVQKRDPSLPHTWFNLGLFYKKGGNTEQALAQ